MSQLWSGDSANFVWFKSIDDTSSVTEGNPGPPNPSNFWSVRGPSDFDQTYRLNVSSVYTTPHWHVNNFRNMFLNDGQINIIASVYSGTPFTILSGTDRSLSDVGNDYVDQIGNPARPAGTNQISQRFNTAAFTPAALGTFGRVGRNTLPGPGYGNVDLSIFKKFPRDRALASTVSRGSLQHAKPSQLQQSDLHGFVGNIRKYQGSL